MAQGKVRIYSPVEIWHFVLFFCHLVSYEHIFSHWKKFFEWEIGENNMEK